MSTIKVKVVGYDEASNAVLVSFASNETQSQNPEDYPPVAIQVHATADIEKVKRDIARMGIQVVLSQINKERVTADTGRLDEIKALIGQEFSFAESDLDTSAFANEVTL
jgi:hypothetical protein